ncbi:hypothetical protein GLOIN_2v1876360 [Rhizophagus irregularis DAOM 181602=DAOM 197198]|uniref:Protein kinase domain-containing protein n=1 Tax=Rhizophagus irregularis (strain DAOM 181602 / DAOM 197198 / MUCL 43194) TaxID=747089 RepID=A0A2P4PZZ1_RHIID|nr:hypothetical protein GLOIN_2v1876360 [Rhizophagus irregularis DAOM 181602=DAOM 197198]POG70932.1 hypothetical protein GLOIN_2v1876360 [Rhizophagus irregularis DAOM 181602=DAOM 197198]|eukprot:XP_025177798.1 hypothetical protein GLOIN_2v1876360 [Rhizophagus irregularis DAOM 181602=DAOM 197198]
MKGWINEVEKHNDDFIWKLIYEEAPNNVREFGLQFLSLYDNKKKIGCDKSTTGSQYVVLKQLKNSKNINGADFILQLHSYYTVMSSEKNNFIEIDWYQKIFILLEIAKGLKAIHDHGYVASTWGGQSTK